MSRSILCEESVQFLCHVRLNFQPKPNLKQQTGCLAWSIYRPTFKTKVWSTIWQVLLLVLYAKLKCLYFHRIKLITVSAFKFCVKLRDGSLRRVGFSDPAALTSEWARTESSRAPSGELFIKRLRYKRCIKCSCKITNSESETDYLLFRNAYIIIKWILLLNKELSYFALSQGLISQKAIRLSLNANQS